ncbi:MAG: SMP-30/gluconolactonase/LRE family protein [Croceibacterium sp.]
MKLALSALALVLAAPALAQSLPGEKPADISAIPGVVAAGAKWHIAWSGPMTADGMAVLPDGDLLFAQEQSNAVWRLSADGRAFAEVPFVLGAGAASVDPQGRILAVERACTDPGLNKLECSQPSRIVQLTPERRVIAEKFADGSSLGRLNDLESDGRGGAWFTQGDLYHAAADGTVTRVADVASFTNGVAVSPDGKVLYTTHGKDIIAFDVAADGSTSNQRTFATVRDTAGFGADGLAVDATGRLYATGDLGVYVYDKGGKELGLIPVPRRAITLALAGPDRRTLYVGAMGAVTPQGKDWQTPQGVRNVAMTIYKLPVLDSGAR